MLHAQDNQEEVSTEKDTSNMSLPKWMRYMPNPPWKQKSSNLNLNLSSDEKHKEGKEIPKKVKFSEESLCSRDNVWHDDSLGNVDPSPQMSMKATCSTNTESNRGKMKKRKIALSSNPFSTGHIDLSSQIQHDVAKENSGEFICSTSNMNKKRRRVYIENESSNLEDTAALFSFCKFNK